MLIIVRTNNDPYTWEIQTANLKDVANKEKLLPKNFINEEGFGITSLCKEYLLPLIQGEDYPTYKDGIPQYISLQKTWLLKNYPDFSICSALLKPPNQISQRIYTCYSNQIYCSYVC